MGNIMPEMKTPDQKRPWLRMASVLDTHLKRLGAWKHVPDDQRALIERYVRLYENQVARAERNKQREKGVETVIIPAAQVFLFRNGVKGIEVFLGKRASGKFQGQWSAPGGKRNLGETFEDAALRELREETGLDVQNDALVLIKTHISQDVRERGGKQVRNEYRTRVYVVWTGDLEPENKSPNEHTAMEWKPVAETLRMHAEAAKSLDTENMITPRDLGIVIEFAGYRDVEEAARIKDRNKQAD